MNFTLTRDSLSRLLILLGGFCSYFLIIILFVDSVTLVINEIGTRFLPLFLMARSILLAGLTFFNIGFSGRFSNVKIFTYILFFFCGLFSFLPFLELGDFFSISYFYFSVSFLFAFLDFGMIPLASSFVNPVKAKRFLPLVSSVGDLGLIAGTYFSGQLGDWIPQVRTSFFPVVLLLLVALLVAFAGKLHKGKIARKIEHMQNSKFKDEIKKSFAYIFKKSRLFGLVALSIVIFVILQNLIEFKLNVVLEQKVDADMVEQVLSQILFAENFIRFALTILFMKRILFQFGVAGTLISFPILLLVAIVVAMGMQWSVFSTAIVYLTFAILYYGTYQLTLTQTFFLLPSGLNRAVTFICTTMAIAFGSFVSSLLLILFYFYEELESFVNVIFLAVFTLLSLWVVYRIKKLYMKELKHNLYTDELSLRLKAIDLLAEKNQANRGEVFLRQLLRTKDLEEKVKEHIIYCLSVINNPESVADLIPFLFQNNTQLKFYTLHTIAHILQKNDLKKYPLTRNRLLDSFKSILVSSASLSIKLEVTTILKYFEIGEVIRFLEDNLRSSHDAQIKINTIEALASFHDRSIIANLEPLLADQDLHIRSSAIVGLWQFVDLRSTLLKAMKEIFNIHSPEAEECTIFIIENLNLKWSKHLVENMLEHGGEKRQIYALLTMIKFGEHRYVQVLLQKMLLFEKQNKRELLDFVLNKYRKLSGKLKKFILRQMRNAEELDKLTFYIIFSHSRYVFQSELDELKW